MTWLDWTRLGCLPWSLLRGGAAEVLSSAHSKLELYHGIKNFLLVIEQVGVELGWEVGARKRMPRFELTCYGEKFEITSDGKEVHGQAKGALLLPFLPNCGRRAPTLTDASPSEKQSDCH